MNGYLVCPTRPTDGIATREEGDAVDIIGVGLESAHRLASISKIPDLGRLVTGPCNKQFLIN
jgi:hypothetical protein